MSIDRSKIEDKYKWQLESMYSSKEEVEKDINKVKELISKTKEYKGKLNDSCEELYGATK